MMISRSVLKEGTGLAITPDTEMPALIMFLTTKLILLLMTVKLGCPREHGEVCEKQRV